MRRCRRSVMRQRFFVSTIESEKKEAAPPARTMESHRPAIYLWSLHQINQRLINAFFAAGTHRHDNYVGHGTWINYSKAWCNLSESYRLIQSRNQRGGNLYGQQEMSQSSTCTTAANESHLARRGGKHLHWWLKALKAEAWRSWSGHARH